MMMGKFAVVFSVIPTTMLLTVSFFVLVVLRKIEEKALKAFGYVIVALLWLSALLIFSSGIYTAAKGRCPMIFGMHRMMASPGAMKGMSPKKMKCPMAEEQLESKGMQHVPGK